MSTGHMTNGNSFTEATQTCNLANTLRGVGLSAVIPNPFLRPILKVITELNSMAMAKLRNTFKVHHLSTCQKLQVPANCKDIKRI